MNTLAASFKLHMALRLSLEYSRMTVCIFFLVVDLLAAFPETCTVVLFFCTVFHPTEKYPQVYRAGRPQLPTSTGPSVALLDEDTTLMCDSFTVTR